MSKTNATNFFGKQEALNELDKLKFAFAALSEQVGTDGSYEKENAKNAYLGIRHRIDYLHDSFSELLG